MLATSEYVIKRRLAFVLLASERDVSKSEACRQFCISRKTGYKWLDRYKEEGMKGLYDRERRPKASPLAVGADAAIEVIRMRTHHPTWGAKKIRARMVLDGYPNIEIPSVGTISRILRRCGQVKPNRRGRQRRGISNGQLSRANAPNDVWTVDLKGWWRVGDGSRCEPLTVRDLYSRYILCLRPMVRHRTEDVLPVFAELFTKYGLPNVIRSDNGPPFASTASVHGLTRLSAWWRQLGITHDRIEPGHPEQNGSHERMHLDIAREIQSHPGATLHEEGIRLEEWQNDYNMSRPHEALKMQVPASIYRLSRNRLEHVVAHVYPAGMELRRVKRDGTIKIGGKSVYISEALKKYVVGVESVDCNRKDVWFCNLYLGELDIDHGTLLWPTASSECHDNHKV